MSDKEPVHTIDHEHSFVYLRQEKTNIGPDLNPIWLYSDVFFCEVCLEYRRVKLYEARPSRESFHKEDVIRRYDGGKET